jgi:hypothetical protein
MCHVHKCIILGMARPVAVTADETVPPSRKPHEARSEFAAMRVPCSAAGRHGRDGDSGTMDAAWEVA